MIKLELHELKIGMMARGIHTQRIYEVVGENDLVLVSDGSTGYCDLDLELPHINPKFKVGDVIKYTNSENLIIGINKEYYVTQYNGSIIYNILFQHEHLMEKAVSPIGVESNVFSAASCSTEFGHNETYNHFKNTEEKMNIKLTKTKLTEAQRQFLPPDVQKLVELGVLDDELQVTPPGSILLTNLQVKEEKTRKALIEMAEALWRKNEVEEDEE